jgi:hypothetical protein
MRRCLSISGVTITGFLAASSFAVTARGDVETWLDALDAVIRRAGPVAPLNPQSTLPDIVQVTLSGWQSPTASTNPYNGSVMDEGAPLFRVDVTFAGRVNPPGPNDAANFNPFLFGPSPVFGFFEFNADRNENTGGEFGAAAAPRFLANVGRFGLLPSDSTLGPRAVFWGDQVDSDFNTPPQFERSGTEFILTFCGCFAPSILTGDNGNGVFDSGETWLIRGNFWQRAEGYRQASFMTGGPQAGLWQPEVQLRWSHNQSTNQTTVTLVGALTQQGAAALLGATVQTLNHSYSANWGGPDHTSVHEALNDVIVAASVLNLPSNVQAIAGEWPSQGLDRSLEPDRWRLQAIVGTSYLNQQPGAPFVWTDVGFEDPVGNFNYDDFVTTLDRQIVRNEAIAADGGPRDADGVVNGSVQIQNFGANFCAYDINSTGFLDVGDRIWYCPADQNDDGLLSVSDFTAFLQAYSAGRPWADMDGNGLLNVADFTSFLQRFSAGCP